MEALSERLEALLELVASTEDEEIDCDEFLGQASELLEAMADEGEIPPDLASASQHLTVCPECREEFEALIRAVGPR